MKINVWVGHVSERTLLMPVFTPTYEVPNIPLLTEVSGVTDFVDINHTMQSISCETSLIMKLQITQPRVQTRQVEYSWTASPKVTRRRITRTSRRTNIGHLNFLLAVTYFHSKSIAVTNSHLDHVDSAKTWSAFRHIQVDAFQNMRDVFNDN